MPKNKKKLVGNIQSSAQRKRHEAEFCTLANKWFLAIGHTIFDTSVAVEAKIVHGKDRFRFDQMRPHQIASLVLAQDRLAYKISDIDQLTRKPFDIVWYKNASGMVAVKWIRHGDKTFYMFRVDEIVDLAKKGVKSLSEEEVAVLKSAIKVSY